MIIGVDSLLQDRKLTNNLPGPLLIIIQGKSRPLVTEESIKKEYLGNQMAVKLKYNNKVLVLINIY